MAFRIEVTDDAVTFEISGWWDTAICFSQGATVPLASVTGARATTWDDARAGMGWRTTGSYVPGRLATGWYALPEREGARQLWAVKHDRSSLLVVDTDLERPARLVVATPDAAALAQQISDAIAGR